MVMNLETKFQMGGIEIGIGDKDGIVGYIPVFSNKKSAEKYAKRKENAGEIVAIRETTPQGKGER
jgi:hypothetical protein